MSWIRITLKLLQLIACIGALIFKKLTDKHAMRVFTLNQKFSREWSLLNNLTWSQEGHDFSILTYGGYTFITGILFISNLASREVKRHVSEQLLLVCGMLFFSIQGFLVFTSLEYIPRELEVNAYVLGSLTFFIALLFMIDLFYTPRDYYGFDKKYELTKKLAFNSSDLSDQYVIKRPKLIINSKKVEPIKITPVSEHPIMTSHQPDVQFTPQQEYTKSGKYLCEDIDKRKRWINGKLHTLSGPKQQPLTSDSFRSSSHYIKNKYFNTDV